MQRSQASFTAAKVARLASLDALYQNKNLLPPEYLDVMVSLQRQAGILRPFHERLAALPTYQKLISFIESNFIPGSSAHMSLRKRYVLDQVEAAINAGSRCVVNLGAGFDALTFYLAKKYPDVNFCEIDHPLTSHAKEKVLKKIGDVPENLRLIPVDLSRVSLAKVIDQANIIKIGAPTTFVAEGLLMYLPGEAVIALFRDIVASTTNNCRVVFTYLPVDEAKRPMIGSKVSSLLSRFVLRLSGEPMHWGCNPEALPDFLAPFQLHLIDDPTAIEVTARYLDEIRKIPTLEWFVTVGSKP